MSEDWSKPDINGISILKVDTGAKITLRRERKRRALVPRTLQVDHWPSDMRKLAVAWIKNRTSVRVQWTTLTKAAGANLIETAHALVDELLKVGLITVEEGFKSGQWRILRVEFTGLDEIRQSLGIQGSEVFITKRDEILSRTLKEPLLEQAKEELRIISPQRAIALAELLCALDDWIAKAVEGTEREFALHARGDTKGITAGEWKWLRSKFALADFGVEPHSPILWIRMPCRIQFEASQDDERVDLTSMNDFIGIPLRRLKNIKSVQGTVKLWRLFENRTNFENAAARQENVGIEAIVWIPGFPPPWWRESLSRLLQCCPAPAEISCDPDPSGIHIAKLVGSVWDEHGLSWVPSGMSPEDLTSLEYKKSLSEFDIDELRDLIKAGLPPSLASLAEFQLNTGLKGEQEGLLRREKVHKGCD